MSGRASTARKIHFSSPFSSHSRVKRAYRMSRPPSSRCACHTATMVPSFVWVSPGYETWGPLEVAMIRGIDHVRPPSDERAAHKGKRLIGELFHTSMMSFFVFSSRHSAVGVL